MKDLLTWSTENICRTLLLILFIWGFAEYVSNFYREKAHYVIEFLDYVLDNVIVKFANATTKYRNL